MSDIIPPASSPAYGISLDAPEARIGSARLTPELIVSSRAIGDPAIPAAALVPCRGERVRADFTLPSHPRGPGHEWPPDPTIDPEHGVGRFPVALAWSRTSPQQDGVWGFSDEKHHLSPFAAIAANGDKWCTIV